MANASAEKLKGLALRHGEKVGVGLTAGLCAFLLFTGATEEKIDLTPEQVKKAAEAANQNITRNQNEDDILKRLSEEWLKKPEFTALVDKQATTKLVASDFKARQPWVSPEPGAGLLRDDPVLIAVSELYAYPGRGGVLMYELDKTGERIKDDGKGADEDTKVRRGKKKKKRRGGQMGGSSSMMPGMASADKPKSKEEEAKEKKELEEKAKRLRAQFSGGDKDKPKTEEAPQEEEGGPYKETTVGQRWVVITGTLDHQKLCDNYLLALKRPEVAHPHYKRLDVERQIKQADGTWSDWEQPNWELHDKILDNLPEEEEEMTPDDVRIAELVDPLPFLRAGYWERAHIASLVPQEKKELPKAAATGGEAGMMGGSGSSMSMAMSRMNEEQMPRMPMTGSSMGMMGMMGGMGATGEDTNFAKTEADTIMIRSLDFTAEPDTTYRYRVRIVVFNPNFEREDVNPGVETKKKTLYGPWSEPSEEVTMPADVTAYAYKPAPNAKKSDVVPVQFQVTKWNPDDGVTVVKTFDASPGDIIGEPRTTDVPVSDGSGKKSTKIDFNSRQILLDSAGGTQAMPKVGASVNFFEVPAVSLLLRPDGSVVLRNQASDSMDEVRLDIESNYKKEIEESTKKREKSQGSGSSAMMMMGSPPGRPGR